eukprot:GFKZ01013746.1.p1 GENE.GFKZ01013746.1~~GFKZ01013746.1.p1  ORF type:complete len:541 (-),score=39.13 GFKZ01013746.1:224-1846(-)
MFNPMRSTKQRSRRPILFITVLFALVLACFLPYYRSPPSPSNLADHCFVVGYDPTAPSLWQFNSRALCLSSSVCISTRTPEDVFYHAAKTLATDCSVVNADFRPQPRANFLLTRDFASCPIFQRRKVQCIHGKGLLVNNPECPERIAQINPYILRNTTWFEHFTILVPAYPFPDNIFHFSNIAASIPYFIERLPDMIRLWGSHKALDATSRRYFSRNPELKLSQVTILFRIPKEQLDRNPWGMRLLNFLLDRRILPKGVNVDIQFLDDEETMPRTEHVCMRNALVLGRRGHVNLWPFPNNTAVPVDGLSVPYDAVAFKRAVYEASQLQLRLPEGKRGISELPPLVLGYAQRLSSLKDVGDGVFPPGLVRQFSAEDEQWFGDMLKLETKKAGIGLHVFTTKGTETLEEQVKNIAKVGFVVGIHGANLVNSVFMLPFGGLLEILPNSVPARCYIAGMNSGLAYYRHESTEIASPEESECPPTNELCAESPRYRRVKLGSVEDRDTVQKYVQQGIQHLKQLHKKYPNGIPVLYDEDTGYYQVQ